MIEARITCICNMIRIPDLGQELFKGDVVYVEEKRARNSKDLAIAQSAGGVLVKYVRRCREERSDKQPPLRKPRNPVHHAATPPGPPLEAPSQPPIQEVNVDMSPIIEAINDLKKEVRYLLERDGISTVSRRDAGRPPVTQGEEPIRFVPDRLVDKNQKADISLREDQGDSDQLDAALQALKKVKEKKNEPSK